MLLRVLILIIFVFVLFDVRSPAGEYRKIVDQGVTFHGFVAAPSELNLHWRDADGTVIRKLDSLAAGLETKGRKVEFLGNAGIFRENGTPLGLHVEGGKELHRINKVKEAYGNFYLQPNGVFFIESGKAKVTTTDLYLKGRHHPTLATQSGPMLVIDGRIHPKFRSESSNRLYRNGVGILPDGRVLLVITDRSLNNRVNLHGFATMFLNQGCQNALFLDGGLSSVRIPEAKIRIESGRRLGPLLSVSK